MKIAVLSGKGGAGKTMTAVNLASVMGKAVYIDCDVEEPNGRLFLKYHKAETKPVNTLLPVFDASKCTGCRRCVDFCRFNALIFIKDKPVVFDEVCHSCGGCMLVCPEDAVSEKEKCTGHVEIGQYNDITVITGELNTGEASGVPVISAALKEGAARSACDDNEVCNVNEACDVNEARDVNAVCGGNAACADEAENNYRKSNICDIIIDCPPGSACSVMESIEDADVCLIVAEPTAFGFDNFKMVYELTALLDKPCAVIINKQDESYMPLESFCEQHELPILARIPFSRRAAEIIGKGQIVSEKDDEAARVFKKIYAGIRGGALR